MLSISLKTVVGAHKGVQTLKVRRIIVTFLNLLGGEVASGKGWPFDSVRGGKADPSHAIE